MSKLSRILAPVSVLLISLVSCTAYAELPQIADARVIQPPPGANVAAAYFTITNVGDNPLVIDGASSEVVKIAELHLSSVVDDVARMEEQKAITLEAGESLQFKHGSYHVMLMGLIQPLVAGTAMPLTLNTSEGPLTVSIPVITPDEATAMDAMTHDAKNHTAHDKMGHDGISHGDMDAQKKMDHK